MWACGLCPQLGELPFSVVDPVREENKTIIVKTWERLIHFQQSFSYIMTFVACNVVHYSTDVKGSITGF